MIRTLAVIESILSGLLLRIESSAEVVDRLRLAVQDARYRRCQRSQP